MEKVYGCFVTKLTHQEESVNGPYPYQIVGL